MDLTTLGAFHFLHPAWLLCLPPLLLWAIAGTWRRRQRGAWAQVVAADLLPALRLTTAERSGSPWPFIALAWTCAALALAGPAWLRAPSAGFRAPDDWVIVLDLSPTMSVADVSPNRVTRARYAIEDILAGARDARVGLIVFSGEAHVVVPLTSDVATIRALLPPLSPGIMPEGGDEIAPALDAASQLLHEAASRNGKVVVLSDGFTDETQALGSARALAQQGASVQVIGVGTREGGPAVNAGGSFVQNAQGTSVLAKLPVDELQRLAEAGDGRYWPLTDVPGLLASLHPDAENPLGQQAIATNSQVGEWRNEGIWLLPPLLLFATLIARRGWL
jgi:Ca-activated chloride channel family protein